VTDLARAFPVSLASTSKHIRVLESAGLITRRVHGRDHLISLEPRRLAQAGAWIEGYRSFWESRLDKLGEALQGGGPTQRTDDKEEP
jgi:DNA-binding transcriptional ArsR family regulator